MKKIFLMFALILFAKHSFSQVDSILKSITDKNAEIEIIEAEILEAKKQFIEAVKVEGYETELPFKYNQKFRMFEGPSFYDSVLVEIEGETKVRVFEKNSSYYKVEYDGKKGWVMFNPKYPLTLLSEDFNEQSTKGSSTSSGSSKKCSSRQCSGTTKSGSRCRNKTTNCSGRCHLH